LQQQRDALNAAAAQSQTAVQTQAETFGRSLFTGQVNDASLSDTQYVTSQDCLAYRSLPFKNFSLIDGL